MDELITVVTPAWNQARFLRDCLLAVSGQSYGEVEHIVVDGGSSDGTLGLLAEWADPPKRRYVSEPDRGMYEALNKGFRLAKGELFAYLNCDDLYLPHSVEVLVKAQKKTGADVVYGDMVRLYEDERVVFKLQPSWDSGFYGRYYQLAQPSTLWTRELFEALGGFDSTYRYAGDTDFFLRAAALGARFAHVDEIVCVERHRAGSLSAAFQDRHREEIRRAVRSHGRRGSPWERVVGDPARILRALGRQAVLAAAFSRAFRSSSPGRWARFLGAGYLESLSTAKLLLNVVPAPLLPRKVSAGRLRTGSWADDPEEA
jgi:glycosyltransferase involved in cell wall biosynthesis